MTLKDFCNWAFYGQKTDILKPEEVYTCYLIWCELFKVTPMKKFEFIEMWGRTNQYQLMNGVATL